MSQSTPTFSKKRLLVTSALPYANGGLHLGHLVEHVQTDIFVRAHKLLGRDVLYVCGDDTHGAPIEINARKLGLTPEEMVARFEAEHVRDFKRFGIEFDGYYGTHHDTNRQFVELIYERLKQKNLFEKRAVEQLYCGQDQRFLPDRFVRGQCPKCGAQDQYGDTCEVCGATYTPADLKEPKCALCGQTPLLKQTEHLFFKLEQCRPELVEWLNSDNQHIQPEVRKSLANWLGEPLKDWCITRDAPYFGFKVPDRPHQYFYVWLDAPIGYIAAAKRAAEALGRSFDDYWLSDDSDVVHVIGKDIVYFHALFWPAILKNAGFQLPRKVHVHGMLRVDGEKMSKSRGTFINAHTFAEHLDPQYLRYYFAAKLGDGVDDLDLSVGEFVNRINADLINKIVNLVSRVTTFVHKNFAGKLSAVPHTLLSERVSRHVHDAYFSFAEMNHAQGVHHVLQIAEYGNSYFQGEGQSANHYGKPPWTLIKESSEQAQEVASLTIHICQALAIALKPVLPHLAAQIEDVLNVPHGHALTPLFALSASHCINAPARLLERVETQAFDAIIDASKESLKVIEQPGLSTPPSKGAKIMESENQPLAPTKPAVDYEQFAALDFRAGKIVAAERVAKSDKLLKLWVDIGEKSPRIVVAGIGLAYQSYEVVGRSVICLANLKPAKLMGIESQGMLLAAGSGGQNLWLSALPDDVAPGSCVQ